MEELIEDAYNLFYYDLNGRLSVCTCPVCIMEEYVKELLMTPIKDIKRELMYEYLGAVNYDETGYEIKHFLPRILELIASYEELRVDDSLNLDKCHFEKDIWSREELDYMKRFSAQFIIDILNTDIENSVLDDIAVYIVMFDLAGLSTEHLLDVDIWLEKSDRIKALKHLEKLMYYYTDSYTYFKYTFSVNPKFNNMMNEWLGSRKLAESFIPVIEEYYFDSLDMEYEEQWRMEQLYNVFEKNLEKEIK